MLLCKRAVSCDDIVAYNYSNTRILAIENQKGVIDGLVEYIFAKGCNIMVKNCPNLREVYLEKTICGSSLKVEKLSVRIAVTDITAKHVVWKNMLPIKVERFTNIISLDTGSNYSINSPTLKYLKGSCGKLNCPQLLKFDGKSNFIAIAEIHAPKLVSFSGQIYSKKLITLHAKTIVLRNTMVNIIVCPNVEKISFINCQVGLFRTKKFKKYLVNNGCFIFPPN